MRFCLSLTAHYSILHLTGSASFADDPFNKCISETFFFGRKCRDSICISGLLNCTAKFWKIIKCRAELSLFSLTQAALEWELPFPAIWVTTQETQAWCVITHTKMHLVAGGSTVWLVHSISIFKRTNMHARTEGSSRRGSMVLVVMD